MVVERGTLTLRGIGFIFDPRHGELQVSGPVRPPCGRGRPVIGRLLFTAVLAASSMTKLPAAGGGVITVEADHFRYSFPNHRIEYTGNPVRLTRGDATLTCKRLGVQMNQAEQVSKATCEEAVRFERGDKVVTCQKATYDEGTSKLTCEGDPEVKSGGSPPREAFSSMTWRPTK